MKALSCVYMVCCVWATLYIGTTIPIDTIIDAAAISVVVSAVWVHVDNIYTKWFD